jgi:hypothetical protein
MAGAIVKFLQEQDSSISKIPIVVFDPEYKMNSMNLLAHMSALITVVSQPYQYLITTPSTLVMCIYPPAFIPIYETFADSLFPSGPAATLCNTAILMEHPWHAKGLRVTLEQRVPRVAKVLELYDDPVLLSGLMEDTKELGWMWGISWLARKSRAFTVVMSSRDIQPLRIPSLCR